MRGSWTLKILQEAYRNIPALRAFHFDKGLLGAELRPEYLTDTDQRKSNVFFKMSEQMIAFDFS